MQNISKTADSTNSRGINNFVGNGVGGGSNNNVRGGHQQHQEENESFTKARREVGATQNDSFRKGESPHNRDALNSKSKKASVGQMGSSKDNNSLGGMNIGNYAPGLTGIKMQQSQKNGTGNGNNSGVGGNQISSNFNDISAGFRMMTQ